MTQQYLAGELSLRLAQLEVVIAGKAALRELTRLRLTVEDGPLTALSACLTDAVRLTDRLCWDALARGDAATFATEAAIGADLREFGVCARLLEEEDAL
jgi:hypothetical protein